MKMIITVLLFIAVCYGCKKDIPARTLNIHVTNISSNTTYRLKIKNANGSSPDFEQTNANTSGDYTLIAASGTTLTVTYTFVTLNQQYGQGNIDIKYGSQTLLAIDGGYGTQTVKVP